MHSISSSSMTGKYERGFTVISYPARRKSWSEASSRLPLGSPNFNFMSVFLSFATCHSSLVTGHCFVDLGGVELAVENGLLALRGDLAKEAGLVTKVAAPWAVEVRLDQERVLVAVHADLAYAQPMPGGLALGPELLA